MAWSWASCPSELIAHPQRSTFFIFQRVRSPSTRTRIHVRSERKADECQKHEHHLICGPERHCDKTCDNMFRYMWLSNPSNPSISSPPMCVNTLHHAKCYFPRCVCNDGYVRDENGICIRPSHCPNTYYEPASMLVEEVRCLRTFKATVIHQGFCKKATVSLLERPSSNNRAYRTPSFMHFATLRKIRRLAKNHVKT